MAKKINKQLLVGEWVHSREEDTDEEIVYRPASYDFPLVRSIRETLQFEADGKLIQGGPSPSDKSFETESRWDLKKNQLTIYADSKPVGNEIVSSINKDKLVLKKN